MVTSSYLGSRVAHRLPAVDANVLPGVFLCEWREKAEAVVIEPRLASRQTTPGQYGSTWKRFIEDDGDKKREERRASIGVLRTLYLFKWLFTFAFPTVLMSL